ncbi:MAG TPA: transporter, partial [Thermoguttaceae bacterium]|nr:transporter [Thermoguttaceae bacterium]
TSPATGSDAANQKNGEKTIGEKPPEPDGRLLVRSASVLLKPGEFQTEVGAIYARQESWVMVALPTGIPALERIRRRRFIVPYSLRYGWDKKNELFGTVPFGLSFFERDNFMTERKDETGVLGDVTLGLIHQIETHDAECPTITATLSVTAPTGASILEFPVGNDASLGSGFWLVSYGLNAVKSYDPFVVFGGIGHQHAFGRNFRGVKVEPGDALTYYFGTGFAVTDDISLGARLIGSYNGTVAIDGIDLPNSDTEPIECRLSMLRRITAKSRIQTFVQFGLTNDGSDALFGLLLVHDE